MTSPEPAEARAGGAPQLKVLLKGAADVRRALLDPDDPSRPSAAIRAAVGEKSGGETELVLLAEETGPIASVLSELRDAGTGVPLLVEWRPDVLVLSLVADALDSGEPKKFLADALELVKLIKERVGCHVLLFNCSSIQLSGLTSNYFRGEPDMTLRIHHLNRAAIELSTREGISIVDVDYLAAQNGADGNVEDGFHYSDELEATIGDEVVAILADYGFFEKRPLVSQIGRQ